MRIICSLQWYERILFVILTTLPHWNPQHLFFLNWMWEKINESYMDFNAENVWCRSGQFITTRGPSQYTLQWRHNGRDSASNHQPHDCLLNRLFRSISKHQSSMSGEFPAQMASNSENVSIWWLHHQEGWKHLVTSSSRSHPSGEDKAVPRKPCLYVLILKRDLYCERLY